MKHELAVALRAVQRAVRLTRRVQPKAQLRHDGSAPRAEILTR